MGAVVSTADQIRWLAGELLEVADSLDGRQGGFLDTSEQWLPSGFSASTNEYGARRHRDIDDALAELLNGDEYARQVAEKADKWLVLVNRTGANWEFVRSLAPETADAERYAIQAVNNAWGVSVLFSRQSYHAPYKLRSENPDALNNRYFDFIDGHAVVFLRNTTPEAYAEHYAQSLLQEAAALRRRAKEADAGIIRPD